MTRPTTARSGFLAGLSLAAAMFAPLCVSAQDYQHVAPNLPQPTAQPSVSPPPTSPVTVGAPNAVILPQLKGLVFRARALNLAVDGVPVEAAGLDGVSVAEVPALADPRFKRQMSAFVGKAFTAADMARLTAQTRSWFAAHDDPFVDVTVPPQNVTSGVVQVVVTKFRLGGVEVVGNRYFSKRQILAANDLKPGQAISLRALRSETARMNGNPFLSVDAVFKPGPEPGMTDLELRAKDRFPLRVYAGYDNQGYRALGLSEWDVGFNWGNPFGTGQILSYQYTRSFNGNFESHSISDVIPLPWRDKLLIFGAYARVTPPIATGFNNIGHSGQASVRYDHTLPDIGWLKSHVQAGYDFKTTDNNLEFQGLQVLASSAEVHQFLAIFDGTEADRYGQTTFENQLVYAPGGFNSRNTDAAFDTLTPGAKAHYVYDRLTVTRTTLLPAHLTWVARGALQESSAILPNSEQLGGGGLGSVRGYYPDTGLGSNGLLISQEIRLPAFSLSRIFDHKSRLSDLIQPGVFFDYARLRQPETVVGGAAPLDLASTGIFLHYSLARHFDVNLDLGFRLKRAPTEPSLGQYAAVSVVLAY